MLAPRGGADTTYPACVATIEALVLTVSTRAARGERTDLSGPRAAELLRAGGVHVREVRVVGDDVPEIQAALRQGVADGVGLILTTGGTGIGPHDHTPEATDALLDRRLPGLAEEMRRAGALHHPAAVLSRALVGTIEEVIVVNAPGSPDGAATAVEVLLPLLGHMHHQLAGGDH